MGRACCIVNPRCACAARVTVVVLCVCVCVCVCLSIEILRMAALSIELSHVLCIKSNYLQNGCVVCRKTFVPEIQPKLQLRVLHAAWPRLFLLVCSRHYPRFSCPIDIWLSRVYVCVSVRSFLPPRASRPRNIGKYVFTAQHGKNVYNCDVR